MFQHGNCRSLLPHPASPRHRHQDVKVQRTCVCPAAIRAYRFMSDDIATQNATCSKVLSVASASVFDSSPLVNTTSTSATGPSVVVTMWRDTTVAELVTLLLQSVRADVDRDFSASKVVVESSETCADSSNSTTRGASYVIRLSSGYVSQEGNAVLSALGTVELRQVVWGEPFVFPVRRPGNVDADTCVSSLPYRLGDPLFFTCVRVQ